MARIRRQLSAELPRHIEQSVQTHIGSTATDRHPTATHRYSLPIESAIESVINTAIDGLARAAVLAATRLWALWSPRANLRDPGVVRTTALNKQCRARPA